MAEKIKFTPKQTKEFKQVSDNLVKENLKKNADKLFSDEIIS